MSKNYWTVLDWFIRMVITGSTCREDYRASTNAVVSFRRWQVSPPSASWLRWFFCGLARLSNGHLVQKTIEKRPGASINRFQLVDLTLPNYVAVWISSLPSAYFIGSGCKVVIVQHWDYSLLTRTDHMVVLRHSGTYVVTRIARFVSDDCGPKVDVNQEALGEKAGLIFCWGSVLLAVTLPSKWDSAACQH